MVIYNHNQCRHAWLFILTNSVDMHGYLLESGGERRDAKRRVERLRELPFTVIWENRKTS